MLDDLCKDDRMFSSSSYKAQTSVTCQGSVSQDIFELTVCQKRPLSYILVGTLYEILQAQAWKCIMRNTGIGLGEVSLLVYVGAPLCFRLVTPCASYVWLLMASRKPHSCQVHLQPHQIKKQHIFFLHIKVILVLISLNGSMWQLWVTMAVIRFDFSTSSHHTESYSASGSVGSSCCWRIKHSLIAAFPSWFGNLSFRSLYSLHVLMETFSTVILNQTAAVCFMFAADKKIFCHFYVQPDCWSHWTVDFSVHTESLSRLTVGLKL